MLLLFELLFFFKSVDMIGIATEISWYVLGSNCINYYYCGTTGTDCYYSIDDVLGAAAFPSLVALVEEPICF